MGAFWHWFGFGHADTPGTTAAIERAVTTVEPLLKQVGGYPDAYRKPVMRALEYAHDLASSVPGPVPVNLDSYASDAYVHAIFPSMEIVTEALRTSRAMQDYLHTHPAAGELYALMGMRRREKNLMGMAITGQVIHREVPQQVVYFTSHTLENPATSEAKSRERMAWSFFDSLVGKVAKRIAARKQDLQTQHEELDMLKARLHKADDGARLALEAELANKLEAMQAAMRTLDMSKFPEDFEAVMLDPERHLRINQFSLNLDSMGIRHEDDEAASGKPLVFNELVGFDRRDWIVTMVHCRDIPLESFAARLEDAYRKLSI